MIRRISLMLLLTIAATASADAAAPHSSHLISGAGCTEASPLEQCLSIDARADADNPSGSGVATYREGDSDPVVIQLECVVVRHTGPNHDVFAGGVVLGDVFRKRLYIRIVDRGVLADSLGMDANPKPMPTGPCGAEGVPVKKVVTGDFVVQP